MSQDRKAEFEALVGPHFPALYRAAQRLTRRSQDAEDLVQEVCLRAFTELDSLRKLDFVLGWLLRVQYRVFVDGDRRRRRSPLCAIDGATGTLDDYVSDLPGPEELAAAALESRCLAGAWKRLSHEQRALLALHAEGYGLAELERITGSNRNALGVRLHRARRRLARLLGTDLAGMEPISQKVTGHEV